MIITDYKIIDINSIDSQLLKDFLNVKLSHPDFIILFQIGTFYETLFQDAKVFSDITGTTLSHRKIGNIGAIQQAGISIESLGDYLIKLLNEDIKICLCEEYYDENEQLRRRLVRKYTKGTIIENELLKSDENNFLAFVYADEKTVHFAYADVSTGQFLKTSGTKNQILEEIDKVSPSELLIYTKQANIFEKISSKYTTTLVDLSIIDTKTIENTIINYCIETQKSYVVKLDSVDEYKIESYMTMDEFTRKNLELTRTKRHSKKKGSLIWFLNHTKTPMGARLLKKYINEPLKDREEIIARQNAIMELIVQEQELFALEKALEGFCDLSRICAKISNKTISPKDLYTLVKNGKHLEHLNKLLSKYENTKLKLDQKKLKKALEISSKIKLAIHPEVSNSTKNGNFINDNFDSNLDYLRQNLSDLDIKTKKYEKNQQKKLSFDKAKVKYYQTLGYIIELPTSKANIAPKDYFKIQTLSSCIRYTTQELKDISNQTQALKYKIFELEIFLFEELIKEAVNFVELIRELAYSIGKIDVLSSLARCALENNLTKPEFCQDSIKIKNGYHPSLMATGLEITKNDTELNDGQTIILTGANMAGKSTYLKHNAIICLLAQIGAYVPAQKAYTTILDKLFVRQGTTDDIINNNSSFMIEMDDFKYILENSTKNSLVIMDEPAKSTNSNEGGAIARAFFEYLSKHNCPKTIVATHNIELTKSEKNNPDKFINYKIGSNTQSATNLLDRKITKGICNSSQAINTAILADLPQEIINQATNYIEG